MCKTPKIPDPIPPAPPAPPAPPPPVLQEEDEAINKKATANGVVSRGRASLRIDRTSNLGGQGGGLNIPK